MNFTMPEGESTFERIAQLLDGLASEARKIDKSTAAYAEKMTAFKTIAKEKIGTLLFQLLT
jgi:hypothetical protein